MSSSSVISPVAAAPAPAANHTREAHRKHNLALDGVRWWAFLGVFVYHAYEQTFWWGRFGVHVFFVLSGFLIGRILLVLRADDGVSLGGRLRAFYGRRFLRIFPLYYFVLAMILVLGSLHILKEPRFEVLPFHALYLTNFYMFFTQKHIDSQTHFWTLAVEEHFYLLAPIVVLRARLRSLEWGIVAMALIDLALRVINATVWHREGFEYLSPIEFDILLLGIATAIVEQRGSFLGITGSTLIRAAWVCAGLIAGFSLVITVMPTWPGREFALHGLFPTLVAIASAGMVYAMWTGRAARAAVAVCAWPPFVYLGRISYGLYMYHNFSYILTRTGRLAAHRDLGVVLALVATIVIATLSWYLLEQPLNNLKRLFPYPKSPARV